jgi:hypothetical protein
MSSRAVAELLHLSQILARSQPGNPLVLELQDAVLQLAAGFTDVGSEIAARQRRAYRRERCVGSALATAPAAPNQILPAAGSDLWARSRSRAG